MSNSTNSKTISDITIDNGRIIFAEEKITVVLVGSINDHDAIKVKKAVLEMMAIVSAPVELHLDFSKVNSLSREGKETFLTLKKMRQLNKITFEGLKNNSPLSGIIKKLVKI